MPDEPGDLVDAVTTPKPRSVASWDGWTTKHTSTPIHTAQM